MHGNGCVMLVKSNHPGSARVRDIHGGATTWRGTVVASSGRFAMKEEKNQCSTEPEEHPDGAKPWKESRGSAMWERTALKREETWQRHQEDGAQPQRHAWWRAFGHGPCALGVSMGYFPFDEGAWSKDVWSEEQGGDPHRQVAKKKGNHGGTSAALAPREKKLRLVEMHEEGKRHSRRSDSVNEKMMETNDVIVASLHCGKMFVAVRCGSTRTTTSSSTRRTKQVLRSTAASASAVDRVVQSRVWEVSKWRDLSH